MRLNENETRTAEREALSNAVEAAAGMIPPLWTLKNFVAVNPFLGHIDKPIGESAAEIQRLKQGQIFLPLTAYLNEYRRGRILAVDIEEALAQAPSVLRRADLEKAKPEALRQAILEPGPTLEAVQTYSEWVDLLENARARPDQPSWSRIITEEVAKWCAGRFDGGQSSWSQPFGDEPIFTAWRKLAALDRTPEIRGLEGFRAFVRDLPEAPLDCIHQMLIQLQVPEQDWSEVLTRALSSVGGWAGHLQYRIRQASMGGEPFEASMSELLAIRMAYDGALLQLKSETPGLASWQQARDAAPHLWPSRPVVSAEDADRLDPPLSDLEIRHLWQIAYEAGYQRELIAKVAGPADPPLAAPSGGMEAPALQAAFCIDVRSEVLRRKLEAQSNRIQTLGFAGFFGLAIETLRTGDQVGEPRCPALLAPGVRLSAREDASPVLREERSRRQRLHSLFKQLRLSSVSAFPFVETVGQTFGIRLITDSLGWTRPGPDSRLISEDRTGIFDPVLDASAETGESAAEPDETAAALFGMDAESKAAAGASILRNMGLTEVYGSLILLCGHGSETTNNPYASGLDCGACGGYPGDINARAAAALLNDPAVRESLVAAGYPVPESTRFLAGLHNTTTDEITVYGEASLPAQQRAELRAWLDQASAETRRERSMRLGLEANEDPDEAIFERSGSWSELRPEWGLAGNAAFIAAPRSRTKGIDLGGRTFLHDYHAERDPEGSVLELILTAPLVVASWISLQYYASTVDNETFGSGNKTIHNVVGRHGVLSGNGGDLRVGLPFQSVHDGERFAHEPLRLNAIVEAPRSRIEEIVAGSQDLQNLIEHQWIHLTAIDPEDGGVYRWTHEHGTQQGFERTGDDQR